ncbi:polynucleotide adenylyltransferase [Umbelopsis nana]
MPHLLRQYDQIHGIEVIHRAPVPIIKFVYDNMPVDISFARLKSNTLTPMVNLLDDTVLDGIDDVDNRSLDGPRVHLYIAEVIHPNEKDAYCAALRCIKHWAIHRGIYGKQMGYLNGGTWTLLLCKTYLTHRRKDYSSTQLLSDFFEQWTYWNWPSPVILGEMHDEHGQKIGFDLLVTHTIVSIANASQPNLVPKLFKPLKFEQKYKHYLNIIMFCESKTRQERWKGKLAACIPKMLQLLQDNKAIALAHAWTEGSTSVYAYRTQEEFSDLLHGIYVDDPLDYYRNYDLKPGTVFRLDYYIGLDIVRSAIDRENGSVLVLTSEVNAFMQDVRSKMSDSDRSSTIVIKGARRRDVKICNASK